MNEKLKEIIENTSSLEELKEKLSGYQNYDIAMVLSELSEEDKQKLFKIYNDDELAEILSYAEVEDASDILEDVSPAKVASIINNMEPDDATDIIEEMDKDDYSSVKKLLSDTTKSEIEQLSEYDDNTAGSIMNSHYLSLSKNLSVKEAMKKLSQNAPDAEFIHTLFVTDDDNFLLGIVDLKVLICARMPVTINDIMITEYVSVDVDEKIDNVIKVIRDYDILALPILENGKMKGIITMDDAFDALTDNAEDDYAKLAGLVTGEEKDENVFGSVKKRFPWLLLLLGLDLIIATTIAQFGSIIEKITVLTFFQAAVLGLAGNCGTQALALTVRKISNGQLNNNHNINRHLGRELLQSIVIGLILAVFSFALVMGILYVQKETDINPVRIAFVLSISIWLACILSNLVGTFLPIFFSKIHIDPAVASGPFITTINDIIAIFIYFGMAMLVLKMYL